MSIPKQDGRTPRRLAEKLAQMIVEWVEGSKGGDWKTGLPNIIQRRIDRLDGNAHGSTDALRSALADAMTQAELDLTSAHAEICKLQGLDPDKHDWPAWSAPANTFRWFKILRENFGIEDGRVRAALSSSSAEIPRNSQVDALREVLEECIDDILATAVFDGIPKFEAERNPVILRARAALSGTSPMETEMTEAQIKHMVDRFLMWRLPQNFNPDAGISYKRPNYAPEVDATPQGTNLFDARQATEMIHHMLEGLPGGSPAPST